MRGVCLFLCLLALLATSSSRAGAASLARAEVSVSLERDGIHALFMLDRPVDRFRFAEAAVVRARSFRLVESGLALRDETVTASAPFRRFEIRIAPEALEQDGNYRPFYPVGAGGVLYGPALLGDRAVWRTRLRFRLGPGQVRLTAKSDPGQGAVYIGPASLVARDGAMLVVSAPDTPAWVVEHSRAELRDALRSYSALLGTKLSSRPILILRHDRLGSGIVGEVTPPAVLAMRFHGAQWSRPDPSADGQLRQVLLHESFHLWNGALVSTGDGVPAWLHEGAAEYMASLFERQKGGAEEGAFRQRLGQALGLCRDSLGDQSLASAQLSAVVRYPCGLVLQWAADLYLRRGSSGRRDIAGAWSDLVRAALGRPGHRYGLSDFYSAIGVSPDRLPAAMALIVAEHGNARWDRLSAELDALGADVAAEIAADDRLAAVMFHLLGQQCPAGEAVGFFGHPATIILDTRDRCGALSGAPIIAAVEGRPVHDPTSALYESVSRRCASGQEVRLTTAEGREISTPCREPLPPVRPRLVVRSSGLPLGAQASSATADRRLLHSAMR